MAAHAPDCMDHCRYPRVSKSRGTILPQDGGFCMTYLKKSPWIVHYNASSCNGCDIEILAALTPVFDVERFGIVNTGNPKHADILLVTGGINDKNKEPLKNVYDLIPEPKVVVAIGICATSGGIFRECSNILGG